MQKKFYFKFLTPLFALVFNLNSVCLDKVKLYIGYTPSHVMLVNDWFKVSLTDEKAELVETTWEQLCPSGRFYQKGWSETVLRKFDLLLRGVEENWGGIFIYSDVDIQFFGNFVNKAIDGLGECDVVFQQNACDGEVCSGFIVCRGNERTKELWIRAKKKLAAGLFQGDQDSINCVLRENSIENLQWGLLPWEEFFGPGMLVNTPQFKNGLPSYIPNKIVMHHANMVIGKDAKVRQLGHVRGLYNRNNPEKTPL